MVVFYPHVNLLPAPIDYPKIIYFSNLLKLPVQYPAHNSTNTTRNPIQNSLFPHKKDINRTT